MKRILALVLVLLTFSGILLDAVSYASAASVTYYQTSKTNVPIWSQASSSFTKIKTIKTIGTVLKVKGSTTNSAGNLWYQLSDGYWFFSGNVVSHKHSYTGGICNGISCGYEYPYSVSSLSGTFVVTNSSGAKIWNRPYSNNSTHVTTTAYGKALTVTKKTVNEEGNTWYKLSNGNWIYSGNVTRAYKLTYNANGGSGAPGAVYKAKGTKFTLSTTKPTRSDYTFLGWATSSTGSVAYKAGASYTINGNATLYAVWAKNVAISTSPSNQILKSAEYAKFTVKATGTGLKYQWQQRSTSSTSWTNAPYAGEFTATLTVPTATELNGYQFRCKVTDQYGNVAYSKTANLYVLGVTTQPKTQYVKVGNYVQYSVAATGHNKTYQWQFRAADSTTWSNSSCEGNQTAILKVQGQNGRNGHYFRCKITDSAGNVVYTNAVRLYVLGFKTQPTNQTVGVGEYAKFSVKANGGGITYQWQFRTSSSGSWQNSTVSGYNTSAISVKGLASRNGYQYRCKITDSAGNVLYSNIVKMTVSSFSEK